MPVGDLQEIRVFGRSRAHEVDFHPEQLLQILQKPEPLIGNRGLFVVEEFDEEVDIAAGGLEISAGGGAEQLEPFYVVFSAEGFDLGAMVFDQRGH